jgi:hypothetical protein
MIPVASQVGQIHICSRRNLLEDTYPEQHSEIRATLAGLSCDLNQTSALLMQIMKQLCRPSLEVDPAVAIPHGLIVPMSRALTVVQA